MSLLSMLWIITRGRHLAEKRRLKCIVYKTNNKYYKILTIYECVEKIIEYYRLLYLNDLFEIKLIFFKDPSRISQLSEFVWMIRSLVWVVFNNFLLLYATDRMKISSDQKRLFFAVSLFPLLFFASTPFNNGIPIGNPS